jgi:hypothetical protein
LEKIYFEQGRFEIRQAVARQAEGPRAMPRRRALAPPRARPPPS